MNVSKPAGATFQEKFCDYYGVPAERYTSVVLRLTFYPHARWLIGLASHDFLAIDRAFVAGVGRLTRWSGFAGEAQDFQHAPPNRRFCRRALRCRVSVTRMQVLFTEVWGGGEVGAPARRRSTADNRSPLIE